MIHFTCKRCGFAVRTADGHAGRKARCPSCRGVIIVPSGEAHHAGEDAVAALAAVVAPDDSAMPDGAGHVPPPPPSISLDKDDLDLPMAKKDAAAETDILTVDAAGVAHPACLAGRRAAPDDAESGAADEGGGAPARRREHARAAFPARPWVILGAGAVIIAAIVAAIYLLLIAK